MPDSARSRPVISKVSKILPLAMGGLLVVALVSVAKPALAADTAAINGATTYQTMAGFGVSEGFGQASTVMDASSGLTWAQHIFAGLDSANLSAFLYWWGSTTPSSNGDNEGLVEINGSTVTPPGRLWAFGNFSDFVRPGAVRIGTSTSDGNLTFDAFKNTNGTVTVVALNTGTSADPVTFSLSGTGTPNGATVTPYLTNSSSDIVAQAATTVSGGGFTSTLPARSLVSYVVGASGTTTGNTVSVTNPGSQTSTAGTAASLQVKASDSASGQTLTYSATGLPSGESISSSTGLISGTAGTAGTYSVTVTATDTTGASGSATFTWTVSSSSGGGGSGSCQVVYTTTDQWTGGFTASVAITNTGSSAISSWTLKFTFPGNQVITDAWNGVENQSGENVTISNESYNGAIAAGGSTLLGFQGTWSTSDAAPTAFTVNGNACTT